MANMTKECWDLYMSAHELWKQGKFTEAETVLGELYSAGGFAVSKVRLLGAYVKRSLGEVLGEIDILSGLADSGCQDDVGLLPAVYSLLGQAYSVIGQSAKAVEMFLQSVATEDDWQQKLVEYSNAIFAAAALPATDREFWQSLYAGYEDLLAAGTIKPFAEKNWQHDKLRVGYLSADYHQHPVSALLWALVDKADLHSFSVYCYAGNTGADTVTRQFQDGCDVWRPVAGMPHQEIAWQIYKDEIDILVDLGGHTSGNMLPVLAYKPAKVQMSAIGWVGSTGMTSVDYVLGDEYCTPASRQDAYVERLLAVKGSHFCFHIFKDMPPVSEAPYRKNGYITYGCFNNFSKVTDDMLVAWGKILAQVPKSRLLLKHKLFGDAAGRQYTLDRLAGCGIDRHRVELRNFSQDYLTQYGDMDIALDTFPYTGGMTTFEAMYMGVPVVSLYGASRGQRFGYSMLMNVGLGDMAADNVAEYIEIASALGKAPELVTELRSQLRTMVESSPLMDEAGYVRAMERIYVEAVAE